MNDIEAKFKTLELKVDTIENSRRFDSKTVETLQKKQTGMDALLSRMRKLETEHSKKEQELKAQVMDVQCRSMRDNLIFYRISEERGETDDDCVRKILQFCEERLEIENTKRDIKLHRAPRMGRYSPSKVRPIVAKFAYYPDRELVRKSAGKLKDTDFGISQQFPKDIMDTRKKLVPIMKEAR